MVKKKWHPRHGHDQKCWYVYSYDVVWKLAFEYHHNTQAAVEPYELENKFIIEILIIDIDEDE